MKIYIAGPMRGLDQHNFPTFDRVRDYLIAAGHHPVNPADLDREMGVSGFTTRLPKDFIFNALRRDFIAICGCEAIVFLPGWENSSGARAERFVAEHIGLAMYYIDPATGKMWRQGGDHVEV